MDHIFGRDGRQDTSRGASLRFVLIRCMTTWTLDNVCLHIITVNL